MRAGVVLAFLLVGCSTDRQPAPPPANVWELGPTISGHNYSTGSVAGNTIHVRDVHYVTQRSGPLKAGTMSITFELSAPLTGTKCTNPATATLYFQKAGDDWNTDGNRWWATFATVTLDHAGTYSMEAPLDGPWTSVFTETAKSNPQHFADAKAKANRAGFTLGNCEGYGHGGTGPATLTVLSFRMR